MPSIRKRIGYLPSVNSQEIITKIANKEKISQSKVVGILVEEALVARGSYDIQNTTYLRRKTPHNNNKDYGNSYFKYNDIDELISDKGIIYNTKKYKNISENTPTEPREKYNEELFEQFKKFILFQEMLEDKS
tara:strand:- start:179 stop:577 length:399 start_codon:yes stop_codon:yes gene_type:complete